MKKTLDQLCFEEPLRFIDIGCGKGYVLNIASKYPFDKIAGVEYDSRISKICDNNMRRLKLTDRVHVYNIDAKLFDHYKDYNVFYFANPFKEEVFKPVLDMIVSSFDESESITLIYYHPICHNVVMDTNRFVLYNQFSEKEKGNTTYIYKSVVKR